MIGDERPKIRGYSLPLLAALLSGISLMLLFGGRGVLLQATAARAGAATRTAAAVGSVLYLPAGAHSAGANGANWRTDVEVHNSGSATASFTVQLLRRDADNSSPASQSYTLAAGRSRRFADVLVSEFGFEGAAALRVSVTSGTLIMTSRTYNLLGANPWNLPMGASFGLFEPGIAESDSLSYGQEGRLIQLTQQPSSSLDGFRTNVGFVNTTAIPIDVRAEFYRSDGTYLGKKDGGDTNLPPYGFRQINEVLGTWGTVADGYAIVRTTTPGGGLIAFATVIDNHYSGDPIFIPAAKVSGSGATPTPTPTATPSSGAKPNLYLYKPSAWASCLSANYQTGCCTNTSCCSPFLSTYYSAFLQMFVANEGPATFTGPIRFALSIDGVFSGYANWSNSNGMALEPGHGIVLDWEYTNPIAAGTHTLTLTVDPDNTIAETNEGDNTCTSSATWTSVVFAHGEEALGAPAGEEQVSEDDPVAVREGPRLLAVKARSALASGATEPIYVPASAHASGLNGSNWRTDMEVHNPGTTAVTYSIALLRQFTDNGGSVPTRTYSLGPQQSVRYVDVLSTVFSTDGAAALRVTSQSGALLVNSRTYNLIGTNSVGLPVGASFGQFVPGLAESEAIGQGEEGRIIQLTHRDAATLVDFRSNVGFVNTTASPIDLRIDLMNADGGLLATIQDDRTHLRPYESKQINGIFAEATGWLEDGYVVVRSTTAGGRFFAFATVIDNHLTGDPIFVPAVKMSSSGQPGPTPTPTPNPNPTATPTPRPTATPTPSPTVPSAPNAIPGVEIINGAMAGLGNLGSGTASIADIANTGKLNGLDAALTQIANMSPQTTHKSGNGLVVDYGSGYKAKDGAIYTGSATIATGTFTASGSHVTWTGTMTPNNLKKDGRPLGSGTANWTVDYTANGSAVVGDASGSATSTSNPGDSGSGSVHFDSTVCSKYPISGSVTMTQAGKTSTASFTNSCDGSYVLSGSGLRYDTFDLRVKKCDGTYRTEHLKVALVEVSGGILKDPVCGNKSLSGFSNVRAWGTVTNTTVSLTFFGQIGSPVHSYGGTFHGTRSAPGQPFTGTASYTVVGACVVSYSAGSGEVTLSTQPSSSCNY